MYSRSIQNLIRAFEKLPSVGPRTAERFVFFLLKSGKKHVAEIANALKMLIETIKSCETCWDFSDTNPCAICSDKKRDQSTICVVRDSQEVQVIESTGAFRGTYHLIRGILEPGKEDRMRFLKIPELLARVSEREITEVILALNPDLAGETTMMYVEKEIKKIRTDVRITRLARGLAMGADVQYADEITLGNAIRHRTENQR